MRYFYGILAIVTAVLIVTQPNQKEIIATALIIAGILAMLPRNDFDEKE